jgi:5'(3')-deoxyribonucleotidase
MNNRNLFIDIDGTITDSISAFCHVYNFKYNKHPDFKPADPNKVCKYDFSDECPLLNESVKDIFGNPLFFDVVDFMSEALQVLKSLNERYNLYLCSIGDYRNIALKSDWIHNKLPFIRNAILIAKDGSSDKSMVNMENGTFIDDHANNLLSSNAFNKICYGKTYEWNKDWHGLTMRDWNSIGKYLLR